MDQHEVAKRCDDLGVASYLTTLESGPKFHIRERVLAVDSQQSGDAVVAEGSGRPPPLYEAAVLKSGLRCVDPMSGAIVHPERKMRGKFRQQSNPTHRSLRDLGGEGDNVVVGDGEGAREWCHLIHFQGWNSRHDCWMREADVFHDTPENRRRVGAKVPVNQKEGADEGKKSKRRGGGGRKCANDDALTGDAMSLYDKNLQLITRACTLPFTLQTILVDEGENITKRVYPPPVFNSIDSWTEKQHRGILMLHVIPVKRKIIDVIGEYVQYGKRKDLEVFAIEPKRQRVEEERRKASADANTTNRNDDEVAMSKDGDPNKDDEQSSSQSKKSTKASLKLKRKKLKQFASSIIALFDVSLPQFLLYKEEREQYEKFVDGGGDCDRADAGGNSSKSQTTDTCGREGAPKRPSELYGAEHLLRFLVKLPFILSLYDCRDADNSGRSLGSSEEVTPTEGFILASEELSMDFANHLSNLVIFLQKNLDLFTREYVVV